MRSPVSQHTLIVVGIAVMVGMTGAARAAGPDWKAVEQVASGTPLGGAAAPATGASPTLDTKQIEQALGRSRRDIGGAVFQVTVARAESLSEIGRLLLPAMGVATVLNFQPVAQGKAAITGDAVKLARELSAALDHTNSQQWPRDAPR